MGTLWKRPSFKFSLKLEEFLTFMIPHGFRDDKADVLRRMYDGQRKRTIMGVIDVANRLTEMVADETDIPFYRNEGVSKFNELLEELPDNARITKAWYEILIAFQSGSITAGDNATIAIGVPTDDVDGIVAAVAIDDIETLRGYEDIFKAIEEVIGKIKIC